MLFHTPDTSLKRLKSAYKRALSFAKEGKIDKRHPLAPAWFNCKSFINAKYKYIKPKRLNKIWWSQKRYIKSLSYDIVLLDWFSDRLDNYAKVNILKGDETVSAILYEFKNEMPFDPNLIK